EYGWCGAWPASFRGALDRCHPWSAGIGLGPSLGRLFALVAQRRVGITASRVRYDIGIPEFQLLEWRLIVSIPTAIQQSASPSTLKRLIACSVLYVVWASIAAVVA